MKGNSPPGARVGAAWAAPTDRASSEHAVASAAELDRWIRIPPLRSVRRNVVPCPRGGSADAPHHPVAGRRVVHAELTGPQRAPQVMAERGVARLDAGDRSLQRTGDVDPRPLDGIAGAPR